MKFLFVQACFFFLYKRLTSESNQGGKFDFLTVILGTHMSQQHHHSTEANFPRPDQHLCY